MCPWGPESAKTFTRKANTPKKSRQWSKIASSVLAKTGNEGLAVREANGVIKRGKKKGRGLRPRK